MLQRDQNGFSSIRQPLILLAFFVLALALPAHAQPTEPPKQPTTPNKVIHPSMGVGLKDISDWSGQMPFINLMKQAREWKNWQDKKSTLPIHTDKNGWITKLEPGQSLGTVFLTSKAAPAYQHYIVSYDGDGDIRYRWAAQKDPKKSHKGRDYITVKKGSALLEVTRVNPKSPITNISIVAVEHLSSWKNGEIFNPDWLEKISQFRALRYMDWLKTNNSKPYLWQNRPKLEDRRWTAHGVPLEVISNLSNRLNSIPWINIPHWADTAFIGHTATFFHKNLASNLPIYIEHSNEVWNFGFQQAKYARASSESLWGKHGNGFVQWHGMRTAVMCDTFKNGAFAKEPNRVICTLGVHTAAQGREQAALQCPLWKEAPCLKHGIDTIAVTTYFDAELNGPGRRNRHDTKSIKDLAKHPDRISMAFEQIYNGSIVPTPANHTPYKGIQDKTAKSVKYWFNVAKKHNLSLAAYEGGQHITANGKALQNDEDIIEFHKAINTDPRMKGVYTTMLTEWKNNGGGLHMHFVDISSSGRSGSWGALEHVKQDSSPKWDALMEFNTTHPCWWSHCQQFPIAKEASSQ